MEVIDLPWSEVLRFLVENPAAQVAGKIQRAVHPDRGIVTGLTTSGEYGLRFTVVLSQQESKIWVPRGYENQVRNKHLLA